MSRYTVPVVLAARVTALEADAVADTLVVAACDALCVEAREESTAKAFDTDAAAVVDLVKEAMDVVVPAVAASAVVVAADVVIVARVLVVKVAIKDVVVVASEEVH